MTTELRIGFAYTAAAYVLWGFVPLFFVLLIPTGPWEIVAMRVLFSLVLCVLLLTVTRGWAAFLAILRDRRLRWLTLLAGALIFINWQTYIVGVVTDRVLETSLGYFMNPILIVLLGVIVLRERLRPLQWVAVGIAAIAVAVTVIGYGTVPWIALLLAFSFGLYGLVKKKIGPRVDAVSGLTLETMWLTPVAIIELVIVAMTTGITFGTLGWGHAALLAATGVVTAVPLLLFAGGARRIPLSMAGILQFITPIMIFLIGTFLLHEPMPPERWAGFILVWIAVVVFLLDVLLASRKGRRAAPVELV